jgi:MoaA/NifB/PqqE/SkfB family radical SAM enzyme
VDPEIRSFGRTLDDFCGRLGAARSSQDVRAALAAGRRSLFLSLDSVFEHTAAAQLVTLKILNGVLARWHFQRRDVKLWSKPMRLVVDPSNSCNLTCPGCVHSAGVRDRGIFDWPGGLLSSSRFSALLETYGPTATHICFYNYGEPLIHAGTPAYIEAAKRFLLRTSLSTNLSVSKFDPQAYVRSGLDFMILSIDGATQDVYQRFRRKGGLDVVLENLRRLVAARREQGPPGTPYLVWRFLMFDHNVHELDMACDLARELGVDEFHAVHPDDVSWDDPDITTGNPRLPPRIVVFHPDAWRNVAANTSRFTGQVDERRIAELFDHAWMSADLPQILDATSRSPISCQWLYKSVTMDAGGHIFPCCCSPGADGDLQFSHIDMAQNDGGNIQNSLKHQQAREWFAAPRKCGPQFPVLPYCAQCTFSKRADPDPDQWYDYFSGFLPPNVMAPELLANIGRW